MTADKQREGLKANMRPMLADRVKQYTWLSEAQREELLERLLTDMTEPVVSPAPLQGDALAAFMRAVE